MAAYLQITLQIIASNRPAAVGVYQKYKTAFLDTVAGARAKELLVREEDVQVLHGFDSVHNAQLYLTSTLFTADVVGAPGPLLAAPPEIRIYETA
ncbi:MAG: hypothetical protein ACK5JI_11400 [Azonexus sp.]